jgi:hypothetical protein
LAYCSDRMHVTYSMVATADVYDEVSEAGETNNEWRFEQWPEHIPQQALSRRRLS